MPKVVVSEHLFNVDTGSPLVNKPIQFRYKLVSGTSATAWKNIGSPVSTDSKGNASSPVASIPHGDYDFAGVFKGDATDYQFTKELLNQKI